MKSLKELVKSLKELGITEGPWESEEFKFRGSNNVLTHEIHYGKDKECVAEYVRVKEDAQLIATAPEMLEELIKEWEFIESYLASNASRNDGFWYNEFLRRQDSIKNKILKATGKKWGEIV